MIFLDSKKEKCITCFKVLDDREQIMHPTMLILPQSPTKLIQSLYVNFSLVNDRNSLSRNRFFDIDISDVHIPSVLSENLVFGFKLNCVSLKLKLVLHKKEYPIDILEKLIDFSNLNKKQLLAIYKNCVLEPINILKREQDEGFICIENKQQQRIECAKQRKENYKKKIKVNKKPYDIDACFFKEVNIDYINALLNLAFYHSSSLNHVCKEALQNLAKSFSTDKRYAVVSSLSYDLSLDAPCQSCNIGSVEITDYKTIFICILNELQKIVSYANERKFNCINNNLTLEKEITKIISLNKKHPPLPYTNQVSLISAKKHDFYKDSYANNRSPFEDTTIEVLSDFDIYNEKCFTQDLVKQDNNIFTIKEDSSAFNISIQKMTLHKKISSIPKQYIDKDKLLKPIEALYKDNIISEIMYQQIKALEIEVFLSCYYNIHDIDGGFYVDVLHYIPRYKLTNENEDIIKTHVIFMGETFPYVRLDNLILEEVYSRDLNEPLIYVEALNNLKNNVAAYINDHLILRAFSELNKNFYPKLDNLKGLNLDKIPSEIITLAVVAELLLLRCTVIGTQLLTFYSVFTALIVTKRVTKPPS